MSILIKYNEAFLNKDEAAMNEILHDDYKFTMHASGNVLSKQDVIKWAMGDDINRDKVRIIYENDEIGIEHAFVTFKDGNTQAVIQFLNFKMEKLFHLRLVLPICRNKLSFFKQVINIYLLFFMNLLITILKIKKIPDLSWSSNDPFNFKPKFKTFTYLVFGLILGLE